MLVDGKTYFTAFWALAVRVVASMTRKRIFLMVLRRCGVVGRVG